MFNIYGKLNDKILTDEISICSIDPGKTNFAIRIECRKRDGTINVLLYELVALGNNYFEKLTDYFNEHINLLKKCTIFLMEHQLVKNIDVFRIAQHVLSYFIIRLNNGKRLFYEINPRLKERIGYKDEKNATVKNSSQKLIKTWSINKAYELCNERNDLLSKRILDVSKKKDDLADVICQMQAFCENVDIFENFTEKEQNG